MVKIALLCICALAGVSMAQNGRYRPFGQQITISAAGAGDGRYRGSSDGRYVSDNSGRYNNNDGRYRPDDLGRYNPDGSGAYSGSDGRYNPDGSGAYSGTNGRYNPDGSGAYSGTNGRYNPDGSGAYSGQNEKYRGDGFGSGREVIKTVVKKPTIDVRQGSASGKYDNRHYAILRQEGTVDEDGYHYLYETENGITGEEQGKLANRGTDEEAMRASGFYSYTGPDNVVYTVRYTADENGFVPQGDHLPQPPAIPEAILRSLEYQRQQGTL